jgi:hypothetical protein
MARRKGSGLAESKDHDELKRSGEERATAPTLRGPDTLLGHGLFRADSYLGEVVAFSTIRHLNLGSSPIKKPTQRLPVLVAQRSEIHNRINKQNILAVHISGAKQKIGSSGRTRTYNPPVNSRMLCH